LAIAFACVAAVSMAGYTHHELVLGVPFRFRYLIVPCTVGAMFAVLISVIDHLRAKQRQQRELLEQQSAQIAEINAGLEEQVRERTAQLRERDAKLLEIQKLETAGQLAGRVAHDFNNMLTAILGAACCLQERLDSEHEGQEMIAEIRLAAERSASLTQQLLSLARKHPRVAKPFNLKQALVEVRPVLERLCGGSVTLEMTLCDAETIVLADRVEIEQLVVNLVLNGCHAMDGEGLLSIELAQVCQTDGQLACIRVRDQGCGMDDETLAKACEPFFTTKEVGKGTGLGLFSAREITRAAGGELTLKSKVGEGTTVTVLLPLFKDEVVLAPKAVLAEGQERVLFVDPDPSLRVVVPRALRRLGYDVQSAATAGEALERLSEFTPEVVVTELMLDTPRSGVALASVLQKRLPIEVIYTSGYLAEDDGLDQCDVLVRKPYAARTVAQHIRQRLS
jgi:signal transduction histidine kinase